MVKIGSVEEGRISLGPWGGLQGEQWAYKPEGHITRIIIRHGGAIDSVLFQSENSDGSTTVESYDKFGGPGGNRTDKICIDVPYEQLQTISMTLGEFSAHSVIKSLCFHTNLTKYGPFGSETGTPVSVPMEGGVIFGFHGRAGRYLNAIGIYVAPKITSFGKIEGQESAPALLKTPSSMNLFFERDAGPWGPQRGRHWDDGVFQEIKVVMLWTGTAGAGVNTVIQGILFEYKGRDGKSFKSALHGSFSGNQFDRIDLNPAGEKIVAIEGFYGPVKGTNGFEVITSISIYTDKKKYGPFGGNEMGTHFSSTPSGGKAVGFFGRSGTYLNAIGVHMEYC